MKWTLILLPAVLLWTSCAASSSLKTLTENADKAVRDAAVVAKAAKDAVNAIKEGMKRPDGTTDTSSGAWIGAILGALPAAWIGVKKYLDAKNGLKAAVAGSEAIKAAHPDAAALFTQEAAASSGMTPGAAALIGALKHARRRKI